MKKMLSVLLTIFLLSLTSCETTLNEPATGALLGGGAGAGLGAIIGSQTGHAGAGTAIGAGAGALLGAMVGEASRRQRERTKQEIRDELASQGYYGQQPQQGYYEPRATLPPPQPKIREIHSKYNPRTGKTFPESFKYDPDTGDELVYIR